MDYDDYDGKKDYMDDNSDSSYDDELDKDKGDAVDIDSEREARWLQEEEDSRFDNYEVMCDAAALRGHDMGDPNNPSASFEVLSNSNQGKATIPEQGKDLSSRKRKARGATKGLRVSEPMYLEFDSLGRPRGKWRLKYGQNAGFCMRKLNICWTWKSVTVGKRKLLWEDTMNLFHIKNEEQLKKKFLSLVAKRFRDFKSKLVSGWITKTRTTTISENGREPPDIWKHIKIEDWKLFQQLKTSSPAKIKRVKAIESANKNDHYHHLGQNDFNTARSTWIEDGFYPGITRTPVLTGDESSFLITVDINRGDDWYCAMHSKDKDTGKYVIKQPKTKEVADKYLEIKVKQSQGELIPQHNKDALYYALGEKDDHPGRVRGIGGVNVRVKDAFGALSGASGKNKKFTTDREALKNELREELKNEMKLDLESSLTSILQKMGLPPIKSHNVKGSCPEHTQINPIDSSMQQKIKNDTPCRLHLKDPHNNVVYEVARGKIFPGEECHQDVVGSDQMRVKISIVLEEFQNLPLPIPVPAYDLNLLSDAIGTFVRWPSLLVGFEDKDDDLQVNGFKRKGKGCEVMGSNSHLSILSVTPKKASTQECIVESLSEGCQWLNTVADLLGDKETYTMHFDANLFHYTGGVKTEVYKDDLKQFLKGNELNIPIIQVFIRALQDDIMQADSLPRIGWLCPDATADTKLLRKAEDAITYVTSVFLKSTTNGDGYILAPIINRKHWALLAICPQTYTVYEFDSISLKKGRTFCVKLIIMRALKRYKLSGGQMNVNRSEPLWKSVKCPQQSGHLERGYFVMRYMYDIVKTRKTIKELDKVWNSRTEEIYTDDEINEVREKWATYFTSHCVS